MLSYIGLAYRLLTIALPPAARISCQVLYLQPLGATADGLNISLAGDYFLLSR